MRKSLKILQLYPNEMNIYGDHGNVLALKKRAELHGFDVELTAHEPGQKLALDADIIIGGGGQDSGQDKIQADLHKNGAALRKLADDGTPMLMICGLFQLFGHYFETNTGHRIDGIGIFDAQTVAGTERLTGNIVISTDFGEVVGYENHSGLTTLNGGQKPLGTVAKGAGNNGHDDTEGAVYKHVFGSYLHGPLLPKNPEITDVLIGVAAVRKYGSFEPNMADDRIADMARTIAAARPR